jgi:hypothetical protein
MVRRGTLLFYERSLSDVLSELDVRMKNEIDSIGKNLLLTEGVDVLCDRLEEKYRVNVPRLIDEETTVEQGDAQIDVSQDPLRSVQDRNRPAYITGTGVTFYVPFEGDHQLFTCKATTWGSVFPRAEISGNELILRYEATTQDHEAARSFFQHNLSEIRRWLGWISADVAHYNASLRQKVRTRIEARRQKLLREQEMLEGLGIPLRRRDDAPNTYVIPANRKRTPLSPGSAGTKPRKPEPMLSMAHYEHILSVVSNMAEVIERSPRAFREMGEEDLRWQFLVQLNAQYEGQATGETFNFRGKTDILVRWEGKSVFIAECKFWKGPKSLSEALDQLLGYAAWRDTKTALLLFNKQRDFSSVVRKIPEVVRHHATFKRELSYEESETGFRFFLRRPDDPEREIMLTILAFNVPV